MLPGVKADKKDIAQFVICHSHASCFKYGLKFLHKNVHSEGACQFERTMISSLKYCLLLVCAIQTTFAVRPGLLEGDGINFPRRTLSRTQAANCVSFSLVQNLNILIFFQSPHCFLTCINNRLK